MSNWGGTIHPCQFCGGPADSAWELCNRAACAENDHAVCNDCADQVGYFDSGHLKRCPDVLTDAERAWFALRRKSPGEEA